MVRKNKLDSEIIDFIINAIDQHPKNIASFTAEHFNVTRMTINRYLNKLIVDKLLKAHGATKARKYTLQDFANRIFQLHINKKTQENMIWRQNLLPLFAELPKNIIDICHYGVTELVNNVIDHSESTSCTIKFKRNAKRIAIEISDKGVGVFEKIRKSNHLEDARHALLELSKGKLTTDPKNHSGQGIFFSSRMFTSFSILSGDLFYLRKMQNDDDWLIDVEDRNHSIKGTLIEMEIDLKASYTTKDIFDKYTDVTDDDYPFMRTHVPVRLARYGSEELVSRSQAKRILARFDKFSEVLLDFKDVPSIGQAFADEIFRVYKLSNPKVHIIALRTSKQVEAMIKWAQSNNQ